MLGEDHPRTLLTMSGLGECYLNLGRYDEAEALLLEAAEAERQVLGEAHPSHWITLEYLATIYWHREDWNGAIERFSEILELRRGTLGPEHPQTLISMHNLSSALNGAQRTAEAESVAVETLEIRSRVLGETHRHTLGTLYGLALMAADRGDRDTALARLQEAVHNGFAHPQILDSETFAKLRGDPEFGVLFEEIERRISEK